MNPVDGRLGRRVFFDARSRQYPIRQLVEAKPLRSYTWRVDSWLDQGREGACVGFAFAHELNARPAVHAVAAAYARERIYWEAQKIDPWPGGTYPGAAPRHEGTAILAGAKVCQAAGHFNEYRWAFGLEDLLLAVGYAGPAVLGLNWYAGMFRPAPDGRIRPTGGRLGGHAVVAYRVAIPTKTRPVGQVWLHNSWGKSWGIDGTCYLTFDDLERLLHESGEACVPVKRQKVQPSGQEPAPLIADPSDLLMLGDQLPAGAYVLDAAVQDGPNFWLAVQLAAGGFVGANSGPDSTHTECNLPAFEVGDLAIVLAGNSLNSPAPSTPAGWTTIRADALGGASTTIGYRVLQAGDTTTGVWTDAQRVLVLVYSGADASPIAGSAFASGNSATISVPALTAGQQVVGLYYGPGMILNDKAPAGMVNRTSAVPAPQVGGADTNGSGTWAGGTIATNFAQWRAYSIGINAGVSGPGPNGESQQLQRRRMSDGSLINAVWLPGGAPVE